MATYCAKHFTCIMSHKIEAKRDFILYPQSPQAEKRNRPDPTPTPGPQPLMRSCATRNPAHHTVLQARSPAGLVQEKTTKLSHLPQVHALSTAP